MSHSLNSTAMKPNGHLSMNKGHQQTKDKSFCPGSAPLFDDHRVKYHEEDPSQFQTAKARRPRRHTTGGPQQRDAIEKARQMIANDPDIDSTAHESSLGTLNRKQLVSLLKTRYGDDIEKYRSLKKKGAVDEVEHRNLVENGTAKRKKSHTILTYKTSGGVNGHVRRSSTSSQESSQTSQESLNPIASTRNEKTTNQVIRTTKVKQFGRTRKASDGSSVMSGYSSYGEEPHDQSTVTQRTVITRKIVKQPQKDNIIEAQQQQSHEDELKELENLQRQQQVLVTERQSQASSQHQQQKQEVIDRDSHRDLLDRSVDGRREDRFPLSLIAAICFSFENRAPDPISDARYLKMDYS
eukprot:gene14092-5080_t